MSEESATASAGWLAATTMTSPGARGPSWNVGVPIDWWSMFQSAHVRRADGAPARHSKSGGEAISWVLPDTDPMGTSKPCTTGHEKRREADCPAGVCTAPSTT